MAPYIYTRISEALIQSLEESASAGSSALLVGPRYAGKRGILEDLESHLRTQHKSMPVCRVDLSNSDVKTESDLCQILLGKMLPRLQASVSSSDRIDGLFERLPERMVLLASNVDAIAQPVAQQLLRAIESSVEGNKLVAILSGEGDVRELLGGVKNEFRVAQRYFIQGHDEKKFGERVRTFLSQRLSWFRRAIAKTVRIDDESLRLMFSETGGNTYLGRLLLSRILGLTAEPQKNNGKRLGLSIINKKVLADEIESLRGSLTWRDPLVMHAVMHVNQDSSCCEYLDRLLRQEMFEVPVSEASLGPTTLELAGVAVRPTTDPSPSRPDNDGTVALGFASPLMRSFTRAHFDRIRLGDLYVQAGDWNRAISCYGSAPRQERVRPRDSYDRVRADNVIRNLCAELHLSATERLQGAPVRQVDNLFADYCRYVLGYREVSLFLWKPNEPTKSWRDITSSILGGSCKEHVDSRFELDEENKVKVREALPAGDTLQDGPFEVPAFRSFTAAVAVKGIHPNERVALILSDFENRTIVSPTRRRLLSDLIEHYVKAREHAGNVEADELRLYVLEKYHDINRFIGQRLQAERMDVNEVLESVAERIMELGYRKFGAGYYSRQEGRVICGVYRYKVKGVPFTSREWPSQGLAEAQFQAATDGKAEKFLDEEGHALWIIPLRPQAEDGSELDATHTFVVQRGDFAEISEQERGDLTEFGRRLLEGIQESERIILLQSTLKHMTEPVVVVDTDRRLRYANAAMAKLFDLNPESWSIPLKAPRIDQAVNGEAANRVSALLTNSLNDASLTEQLLSGLGNASTYYGRMRSGSIHNSRGRVIGAYLHVQDLSEYRDLLACIDILFNMPTVDALYTTLLEFSKPSHEWCRLYRIDPRAPNVLTGAAALGPASEERDLFSRGKISVTKTPEGESAWLCFERKRPVLFQYTNEAGERRTKYQVPIEPVPNPPWQGLLKKEPGQLWLDVPLVGRNPVGKLSMACDDQIRPEHIEYWRVVGSASALALENLERESEGRETAALAAERVFLASVAHSLHTRIASLDPVKSRYEFYAEKNPSPKLAEINAQFRRSLAMLQDVLGRVRLQLGKLRIEPTTFNLNKSLKGLLSELALADVAKIISNPETIMLTADQQLIEGMLSELLKNSRDVLNPSDVFAIAIEVRSFVANGKEWVKMDYRDKGPGVPTEMKQKIFNLFFTHRTNGTVGTGLGLYYAHRVVLAHGGTILEKGVPGKGVHFVIELPATVAAERS